MTILEKIKFEEDWLSEVNLTKENVKIAFDGIRATALEQQQQPCEDCISLNKLDDIITKAIDESENQTECQTLRWVLDVMSELTSVTPKGVTITDFADRCRECGKQKVGKWIDSNLPQEKYVCSECGGACWYYDYEGSVAKSKYCPNCGVKMEVENDIHNSLRRPI